MSDEVTLTAKERNEVCTCTPHSVGLIGRLAHRHECTLHAQAVEQILAERIAQARREGAAEAIGDAADWLDSLPSMPQEAYAERMRKQAAALRGDA